MSCALALPRSSSSTRPGSHSRAARGKGVRGVGTSNAQDGVGGTEVWVWPLDQVPSHKSGPWCGRSRHQAPAWSPLAHQHEGASSWPALRAGNSRQKQGRAWVIARGRPQNGARRRGEPVPAQGGRQSTTSPAQDERGLGRVGRQVLLLGRAGTTRTTDQGLSPGSGVWQSSR